MHSRRHRMRNRPTEVHLDLDDLAVAHGMQLGVAEALLAHAALVRDEGAIAIDDQAHYVESVDSPAIGPADLEIGRPIEAVVERAGEVEIVRQD
jgi:hypothetical protein